MAKQRSGRWAAIEGVLFLGVVTLGALALGALGCGGGPGGTVGPFPDAGPADAAGDDRRHSDVHFGGLTDHEDAPSDTTGPGEDMMSGGDRNVYQDAQGSQDGRPVCTAMVQDDCGGEEICGDGLDNNCDGRVDEGCPCAPGAVQRCFLGPPGRRGVGACSDGMQVCRRAGKAGVWGDCMGSIGPMPEACDNLDNDCNGCVDDSAQCVDHTLMCPDPNDPRLTTQPLMNYPLKGSDFYNGPASAWKWEITCPVAPCAQVSGAQAQCPQPMDPNAQDTSVYFTLSGDYTVKLTITTPTGEIGCTFIVHVAGPGLRVELCWDTTGQTDVDLHLHRPLSTRDWFDSNDDCYYANCKADSSDPFGGGGAPNWGYANTPIANCQNGPEGMLWQMLVGACRNPRLDIDNISDVGTPENINVDNPNDGDQFRVGVNYFSAHGFTGDTHPVVNIYCGGALKATYGLAPDQVVFNSQAESEAGQFWRVADVKMVAAGNNNFDCQITALTAPGMMSGYWVTTGDKTY